MSLKHNLWLVAAIGAVLVPATAKAQDTAAAFNELEHVAKVGQTLVVVDETGRTTKGTLADISAAALTLDVKVTKTNPTGKLTFNQSSVSRIVRRDSVGNGVLIGLGAGAGAAWAFTQGVCDLPDQECEAIANAIGILTFIPSGTVAGWLIDRAINKTIYRSSSGTSRPSVTISPSIGRTSRGVAASIRF